MASGDGKMNYFFLFDGERGEGERQRKIDGFCEVRPKMAAENFLSDEYGRERERDRL